MQLMWSLEIRIVLERYDFQLQELFYRDTV